MAVFVHIDANRTWGGGQVQSLGLARELAARGHEVHFIAHRGSDLAARLPEAGLSFHTLPLRGVAGLGAAFALARDLRALRAELVHAHDAASEHVVALAIALTRRPRPRLVITRRNWWPPGRRPGPFQMRVWACCDRLVCVSRAARPRLPARADHLARRLVVIPDFVDCHHFSPRERPPDTPPTVVAVGRLSAEKGYHVLLAALARVRREEPCARLVICGRGPEEGALRTQAHLLGLGEAVTFAGFVADTRPYLASATLFVMPSLREGLGVAALEAMAMARPVVATDAGGLPESVVHGETGLIVPAGDSEALAEAMLALLRDPERADQMGQAGRARALAHYDRPIVVGRLLALYEEVLAGS